MAGFFTRSKGDMKYLFKSGNSLSKKEKKRKTRGWSAIAGIFLVLIQIILTVMALFKLYKLDILPLKYIITINIVLILIALYNLSSQFTKARIIGKVISITLSAILLYTFLFASKVDATLDKITNVTTQTDVIDIIVLNSDKAENIKDTLGYTYGYNSSVNGSRMIDAINQINKDNSTAIKTKEYITWDDLITGLYNQDIQVMIISDSTLTTLNEQYENFKSKIKIVGTLEFVTEIELSESDKQVNKDPFIILISGNDESGDIKSTGHSDVNLLVVANPVSRQVLLVSVPRDYYVTIFNKNGDSGLDKLTHSGNDGIAYTVESIEHLFGADINYYVKVNFSGCVKIIDALGGITINSEVEFSNGQDAAPEKYHFVVGENDCDGEKALAFVRERNCFLRGDFQRGRNQMAAASAIINKATSTAILSKYSALLDSISEMMLTNMPPEAITELVKAQLADNRPWNIMSYPVEGTGGTKDGQLYGLKGMSVVVPDYDSVNTAIQLISKVQNGEEFDLDEFLKEQNQEIAKPSDVIPGLIN